MSVEREVIKVETSPNLSAEAKAIEDRAQRKAKLASVLDRGVSHDRLHVPLPPDVYGEWVRDDPFEVNRMKLLGFEDGSEYVKKRAIHSDGASAKVGDVIFMTCPMEQKELIEEVRREQTRALHGEKEEKEFKSQTARDTGGIIPAFTESQTRTASLADVKAALEAADKQQLVAK